MNKLILSLLLSVTTLFSPPGGAAQFEELTHYVPIAGVPPPVPGSKVEVIEFFMWTCPHCMQFEPHLKEWLARKPDDVEFTRVPAVFSPSAAVLARAFYALEALGEVERLNDVLFNALSQQRKRLDSEDALASFVKQYGVDETKFRDAFNSFGVTAKVKRAEQLVAQYRIDAVPKLVIDGRFKNGDGLSSYGQILEVTDFLIDQARQLRQPKSAAR
jgi:thiol:disulfide interchange protein DsbA